MPKTRFSPGFFIVGVLARRLLFVATILAGCAGGITMNAASAGEQSTPYSVEREQKTRTVLELRFDQSVVYQDLELRLLSLDDARCPTGITCVWAGQMMVTLELLSRGDGPVEVELLRKVSREPVVVQAYEYELRLRGVEPLPRAGNKNF